MNTTDKPKTPSSNEVAVLTSNIRMYLQIKSAFDQCDDEIKDVVSEMVEIYNDDSASSDERDRALLTIVDAIFPGISAELIEKHSTIRKSQTAVDMSEEMSRQEATFAENVKRLMVEKEITQEALANSIGVGQPAIANMLARQCRPQRRTVERIADALNVSPEQLWPGFSAE